MSGLLSGRVAAVTGGAGGLGTSICRALAEAGATLAVGYNASVEKAQALAESLPGAGHLALAMPVTDGEALGQAAAAIAAAHGRLDVLVNAAGITRFVPHADLGALDDTLVTDILDVNVAGVIRSVRAFLPLLRERGGTIVNISSIAGTTAMGSNIAYCASKAAVDNLTRSMARAFAPSVRVLSVAPGLVDTEFVRGLDDSWRHEQVKRTPLARLADPAEIGAAVLAVVACLTFSTGAVIPVDGGRPLA